MLQKDESGLPQLEIDIQSGNPFSLLVWNAIRLLR
jgi:hypothetical protein